MGLGSLRRLHHDPQRGHQLDAAEHDRPEPRRRDRRHGHVPPAHEVLPGEDDPIRVERAKVPEEPNVSVATSRVQLGHHPCCGNIHEDIPITIVTELCLCPWKNAHISRENSKSVVAFVSFQQCGSDAFMDFSFPGVWATCA